MSKIRFAALSDEESTEIAIVGAGMSGLYAAWRLISENASQTVTLIERLNRTGGRLDTDIVEVKPGEVVREEEGGMRFNFGMEELMRLNNALGLCDQIVPFPMSSAGNTNRFLLRGHNFTAQDAANGGQMIWSEIYNLKSEEIGLSPTELVTAAFNQILLQNGEVSPEGQPPEYWTRIRNEYKWKGRTLNEWQTWGLLRDMGYSEECIELLSQTIGFAGPFRSTANAGDAFQILADFPKDPHYYTFENGFSTLPNALVAALDAMGDRVRIVLSTNVDAISGSDGAFSLLLTQAPEHLDARPVMPGGKTVTLKAKKVIIAAAAQGMEDLFNRSPALNAVPQAPQVWDAIHASLGMKLQKINLYFDRPWWEDGTTGRPPVQFGPNFTDLPINAIYPFYSLPEQNRVLTGQTAGIRDAASALTIYCDFTKTNFWHGLQNVGPKFTSPLQERENAKSPQVLYAASRAVVDEAKRQIGQLFGTNVVPEPVLSSYRLWDGEEDFEYAYHLWKMNARDAEIRAYLKAPIAGIHFCNEAISDMHGWVNGSLRSTDLVLGCFGIEPMTNQPCIGPDAPEPATKGARRASFLGL